MIHSNIFRAVVETTPNSILVFDDCSQIVFANHKTSETFGYPPGEIILQDISLLFPRILDQEGASPFQSVLNSKSNEINSDSTAEAIGRHKDGLNFPVELSISHWKKKGRTFYSCIIRDISSHKKKHQELEFLLKTSEAISKAADFDAAIGITIREVCKLTGWEFGEAWLPERDKEVIRYSPHWYAAHESLFPFAEEGEKIMLKFGESIAGRVFLNTIEWNPDVSALPPERFARKEVALKLGLKAGLGVPITTNGNVLAVLLFFMRTSRDEDLTLTKVVVSVAQQLGSLLKRKKTEEQLRESEARFRTLFEKSNDPVMLLVNGRFVDCNQATIDLLKAKSKEAVLLLNPASLSPEYQPDGRPSAEKFREMLQLAFEKGWHRFEWVHRKSTGEVFWTEVSLTTISIDDERVFYSAWRDITYRKLAEENLEKEREYLGAVLENVEDGIVGCDENGILSFFNRATREFHGLSEKPLPPEQWSTHFNLFHPDGCTPLTTEEIPLYRAYKGEVVQNVEMMIAPLNGNVRHVLVSGRKISGRDGKSLGAVVVMHDITKRKLAEKELNHKNLVISQAYEELKAAERKLIKANNELEERVRKRTEELSVKNRELYNKNIELIKTNNDLDNFVYIASHDLKMPLLNMEALLGLLRNELVKENAETRFVFTKFEHAIKRMKQTIKDVTEVAKAQRKSHERTERVYFDNILEEVKASIDNLVNSTGAKIHHDFSKAPSLLFSQINLKSILYNLVTNAILYRSPDRQPEIRIHTAKAEGCLVLTVQDNGLGMNLDRGTDKLFAMFTRLHTHVEGSGIGLYIVNRLVQDQGGKIEVGSEVGKGSTFRIYFCDQPDDQPKTMN